MPNLPTKLFFFFEKEKGEKEKEKREKKKNFMYHPYIVPKVKCIF